MNYYFRSIYLILIFDLQVTSNDRELDADFIGVYFIIILKENKQILAFIWGKLLKSYQKQYYHHKLNISWLFVMGIIINTNH